jgi:hypothetical protein
MELVSFRRMRRWFWFTPAEAGDPYVQAIALSPTDANVIVAGIEFGAVLRSEDAGSTWQGHLKGAVRDCHDLLFHPADGAWVYEGGGGGAAFSSDSGKTWTQPDPIGIGSMFRFAFSQGADETTSAAGKLDRRYGWAVAADPAQPQIW